MIELLPTDWRTALETELEEPYFKELEMEVESAYKSRVILPPKRLIFEAFRLCPLQSVKVVLLGQDPYHGASQAHGLSFSVNSGLKFPPSLRNIFKELRNEYPDYEVPLSGDLSSWATQGVLLMNAIMTVEAGLPGSHSKMGWEKFTDQVIRLISASKDQVVFLLWGNYAGAKSALIDESKHFVLKSAHPSPLARGAFFGSKPFSKTNAYLSQHGKVPINWQL